jgi:hypothetical protein
MKERPRRHWGLWFFRHPWMTFFLLYALIAAIGRNGAPLVYFGTCK